MTLSINPDALRAAYDFLAELPPYNRWNLPPGEDVAFHVVRTVDTYGRHWHDGERHHLEISRGRVGYTQVLIETMAHEMIHVHEAQIGTYRYGVAHGAAFRKFALQVCRRHGFDPKNFV